MLFSVSSGPVSLSEDNFQIGDQNACLAPCNGLLMFSAQLRDTVGIPCDKATERQLFLRRCPR
jgi:hypothetical protein